MNYAVEYDENQESKLSLIEMIAETLQEYNYIPVATEFMSNWLGGVLVSEDKTSPRHLQVSPAIWEEDAGYLAGFMDPMYGLTFVNYYDHEEDARLYAARALAAMLMWRSVKYPEMQDICAEEESPSALAGIEHLVQAVTLDGSDFAWNALQSLGWFPEGWVESLSPHAGTAAYQEMLSVFCG